LNRSFPRRRLAHVARAASPAKDLAILTNRRAKERKATFPPPEICRGHLCDRGPPPRCALSSLPKRSPPDVGDLVSNESAPTRWANAGQREVVEDCSPFAERAACAEEGGRGCYEYARRCTHAGTEPRAFEGFGGSGPLRVDVDFPRGARCALLLSEPARSGPRPIHDANWKLELEVVVSVGINHWEDGRPGISSNSSVSPKSNLFSMILEPLILASRVLDD